MNQSLNNLNVKKGEHAEKNHTVHYVVHQTTYLLDLLCPDKYLLSARCAQKFRLLTEFVCKDLARYLRTTITLLLMRLVNRTLANHLSPLARDIIIFTEIAIVSRPKT